MKEPIPVVSMAKSFNETVSMDLRVYDAKRNIYISNTPSIISQDSQ
jgi:hypothetical protein